MKNIEELIDYNKKLDDELNAIWMDAQIIWSEYNMNLSIYYDIVATAPMWLKNKIANTNEGQEVYLLASEVKTLEKMFIDNLDLLNRDVGSVEEIKFKSDEIKNKLKNLLKEYELNERQIIEAYKDYIKSQAIKENYYVDFSILGDIAKSKNEINSALNEFKLKKHLLNIYIDGAKEVELGGCKLMKDTLEKYNEAFTPEFVRHMYLIMQDTSDIFEKNDKKVIVEEVEKEKE